MNLDDQQQQIAEKLYHAWKAREDHACLQRNLNRVADALEAIAKAIRSELEGGQSRNVVRRTAGQEFDTTTANQVTGPRAVYELPDADYLASLTEQWRSASAELGRRQRDQDSLSTT